MTIPKKFECTQLGELTVLRKKNQETKSLFFNASDDSGVTFVLHTNYNTDEEGWSAELFTGKKVRIRIDIED